MFVEREPDFNPCIFIPLTFEGKISPGIHQGAKADMRITKFDLKSCYHRKVPARSHAMGPKPKEKATMKSIRHNRGSHPRYPVTDGSSTFI
jgi:hypothetical protein